MVQDKEGAVEHTATAYLKYFKGVVVVVMTLVLIAVLVFLAMAGYKFMQTPTAPAPARTAPDRQVDFRDFMKFVEERERQRKQEEERQKRGNDVQFVPSSTAGPTVKYLEQATHFYRCIERFERMSSEQVPVVSNEESARKIEEHRRQMESYIDKPYLGEAWLVDFLKFSCAALENSDILAQKREGKIRSLPLYLFHSSAYAAIHQERIQFEDAEKQRVAGEMLAEEARVAAARLQGAFFLSSAGAAFGTLFALAVFLILSRIESNLSDIAASLRNSSPDRQSV